ncbi:MAG: WG repeat-containing protein [Rhodothermaceae bacterium]|nr:WG repeat-containing protein [Rhodothermaceae bacterium]
MNLLRFAWLGLAVLLVPTFAGCDSASTDPTAPPPTADIPLFPVQRDGDWGFMDATGRLAIAPDYDAVIPFSEGLAAGRNYRDGRHLWTFFGVDGAEAFEVEAYGMGPFRDGRARAEVNGRWGLIDETGAWVVNPYMNDARDFSEGLARVKTTSYQWGFMNPDGDVVIPTEYDSDLEDFADSRALFEDEGQWGYLGPSGNVAIDPQFDEARSFSHGRAAVRVGTQWGYIDTSGQFVLQPQFISAGDFAENRAPVRTENAWEYVDANGQRVVEPGYDEARKFSEGRAAVFIDGYWTFIRPGGGRIHPPEFDEVEDFEGGVAMVRIGERIGYIGLEGDFVWYPEN